jgi:hypothetical protein
MTLRMLPDLVQGSPEWLDQRRGMVTASVVGQLITPRTVKPAANDHSRALTMTLAAERITGWTDPVFVSDDMMRGRMDEPLARDLYSRTYAPVAEVGFMVREEDGWTLGFSPDGVVGGAGLVEIKSRKAKAQLATILADEVPLANVAQCQAGLLVSGREWLDYVSFCGGLPLWTKRVYPDPRWFDAIREAVEQFEQTAAQMIATYAERTVGLPTTERSTYDLEIIL